MIAITPVLLELMGVSLPSKSLGSALVGDDMQRHLALPSEQREDHAITRASSGDRLAHPLELTIHCSAVDRGFGNPPLAPIHRAGGLC